VGKNSAYNLVRRRPKFTQFFVQNGINRVR